jgi:hypothetical protein
MLHDMVCPAVTLTQRTRYDCLGVQLAEKGSVRRGATNLAVDFELLHSGHRGAL